MARTRFSNYFLSFLYILLAIYFATIFKLGRSESEQTLTIDVAPCDTSSPC